MGFEKEERKKKKKKSLETLECSTNRALRRSKFKWIQRKKGIAAAAIELDIYISARERREQNGEETNGFFRTLTLVAAACEVASKRES